MRDQPLYLFARVRYALILYQAITAFQNKPTSAEQEKRWYASHKNVIQIMGRVWQHLEQ